MMTFNPARRKVGIFGGSFDPVHFGHLIIAQDAAERLELAEVVFIPAATPPHKTHVQQVDAVHRVNMLKLAVEADMRFSVSDIEIQRGGVSYTFDTLRSFRETHGDADLVLIVGSDTLVDLHTWHRIDDVLEICKVATFLRPGEDSVDAIADKMRFPSEWRKRMLENVIEAHRIEISSTEVRMRIAEGLSIHYLVPPEVEMYIYEHGLYRG